MYGFCVLILFCIYFFQIKMLVLSDFFFRRFVLVFFFVPKTKQTKQTRLAPPQLTLSMATTTTSTPADVNARDRWGRTKIYLAAETGDAAEVARLLQLKADFELPTTDYK